jgi:hypothetical protein
MAKNEVRRLRQALDCWQSTQRTEIESHAFKDSLVTYYGCAGASDQPPDQLKCMLTGSFYPYNEVRASHIIKHSTGGNTMHLYGLPSDINNVRNGLLLLDPIEQAFDRKDICFLYNTLSNQLVSKVLNPNLLLQLMPRPKTSSQKATFNQTYGSVDGLVLNLPKDVFPYRRALSMHAKFAYSRALHLHWIDESVTLDTYFSVSEDGMKEPLGLGLLTWQEVHENIHNVGYPV